jgi:hypothetical protein
MALALAGCVRDDPRRLPPGQYEQKSSSVDSQGTERDQKRSTDVYYDSHGNKKATVDTKTSTDPKGLFNKSTSETHDTVQ